LTVESTSIPYSYQLKAVRAVHQFGGRALLALPMGTGKSFCSLLYALRHPELRPIVIICPATLKWNWLNECTKHFGLYAEVLEGTKPTRAPFDRNTQILIVNYDILGKRASKHCGDGWLEYLKSINPKLIIIDECHFLSGRSKRFRWVKSLCKGVPGVLALSGTPLTNRPADLWPTLNIVRPDLYPSFFKFAFEFCNPRRTNFGWDFRGSSNLDKLHQTLLKNLVFRKTKEELLPELPEKQRIVVPLDLPHRREYEEIVDDYIGWLEKDSFIKADKAKRAEGITKLNCLKMVAGKLKLPLIFDWIDNFFEQEEGKLLVFGIHKKVIKSIYERYKKISVVVDGSVKGQDRQLAVTKFQTHKDCKLFVGNIKAAGVGLNLTAANTVVFAELAWTPGSMIQCEDRAHRIGTLSSVQIFYLIAKDTIEEHLCNMIQKKYEVITDVLDGKFMKTVKSEMNVFDLLTKKISEDKLKKKVKKK